MYKKYKILAIIPARGGSKGVPKKNIIEINGKPLITYSIDNAKKSKYLDKLIVSTDDLEIKEIIDYFYRTDNLVPFLRPKKLAQDTSKTIDCVIHTIETLEAENEFYDYVVILQNTSPLRKSFHIDEAIEKIINSNKNSLVSLSEVKEHPILMRKIEENGNITNLLNTNSTIRRQDFEKYYKVNGAIYIQKIDKNFNSNISLNDGKLGYIMEKKYSIDIDNYIDIKIVEYLLEKEKEEITKLMK